MAIPFRHPAQLSNKRRLFWLPNGSLFCAATDFYSSAKFSDAIFNDYYVYICHFNYSNVFKLNLTFYIMFGIKNINAKHQTLLHVY